MKFKFTILGKKWILKALDKKAYKKKNGKDSVGMTYIHKRKIYVRPGSQLRETLVHELVHAYLAELCVYSADITGDALEEVFCDLLAKFGKEILELAASLDHRIMAV